MCGKPDEKGREVTKPVDPFGPPRPPDDTSWAEMPPWTDHLPSCLTWNDDEDRCSCGYDRHVRESAMADDPRPPAVERLWSGLRRPSPMHDGMRLIDIVVVLVVICAGILVRLWWDSDWTLLSLPLAVVAMWLTLWKVPSDGR